MEIKKGHLLWILLFLLLGGIWSYGQTCMGDITLSSQAEVDAFSCTKVTGGLTITGADIGNLDGLSELTEVTGYLSIRDNNSLIGVAGLSGLIEVGGDLIINDNDLLVNLAGLSGLIEVGGDLIINDNDLLVNLAGLSGLIEVGGDLIINDNDLLVNLVGLSELTEVTGNLSIRDNHSLTGVAGLSGLTEVGVDLIINNNDLLVNLAGLSELAEVTGGLFIGENNSLTGVDGLAALKQIGGALSIGDNPLLANLNGLSALTDLGGSLIISYSEVLTNVNGLSGLTEIGGTLWIYENGSLANVNGLSALKELGGGLWIQDNGSLTNLYGLSNLTSMNGLLDIRSNDILADIFGIGNIDPATITHLTIVDNSLLAICEISNICTYLAGTRPRTISGNAAGCESEEVVKDACSSILVVSSVNGSGTIDVCHGTDWADIPNLPRNVTVRLNTGDLEVVPVQWQPGEYDGETAGAYRIVGNPVIPSSATFNNPAGQQADLTIRVQSPLVVKSVWGVGEGDTLHLAACSPPAISRDDLDLGPVNFRSRVTGRILSAELPEEPVFGMWKILKYEYQVTNACGDSEELSFYVALHDLTGPEILNVPKDTVVPSTSDLPPVPENVRILDICRFVVWDTVTTNVLTDPANGDTLAFVRRWTAEDEVGHRSYAQQMIHVGEKAEYHEIRTRVAKEEDVHHVNFPGEKGTAGIAVYLHKLDNGGLTLVDSTLTRDWNGKEGSAFFNPVRNGSYFLEVDVPPGYVSHAETGLVDSTGWSDTLTLSGDTLVDLGFVLLVRDTNWTPPDIIQDTTMIEPAPNTMVAVIPADTTAVEPAPDTAVVVNDADTTMVEPAPDTAVAVNPEDTSTAKIATPVTITIAEENDRHEPETNTGEVSDRSDSGSERIQVRIYPNPSRGSVQVQLSVPDVLHYRLLDHLGRQVRQGTLNSGSYLDLSGYTPGLYFVQIGNNKYRAETIRLILLN